MAEKKKGKKPLSDDDILNKVGSPLRKAADWSKDNIATKGELGLKFFNRELFDTDLAKDGKPDPLKGLSKHVVPLVQEQVTAFVGQFERVLDGQAKVVEFTPTGPEDAEIAKQMTDAGNFFVRTQNSYVALLDSLLMNGAITGLGVAHINFAEEKGWHPPETLKGVPEEQLVEYVAKEDAGELKILESGEPYAAPLPPELEQQTAGLPPEALEQLTAQLPMLRDIKIRKRNNPWKMRFESVRPENFIVSKDAIFDQQTGGIRARLQGHKSIVARAALVEMGFDEDKVALASSATDSMDGLAMERAKEVDYDQGIGDIEDDVEVYEIYMRLDIDNDGWREHVHLTIAGDLLNAPVLLNVEEVSKFYPYAAFCPFPLPDTLFGHGIADRVGDDQLLISNIYRENINGLRASINPMKVVNPESVNLDDLLNPHPGKLIRSSDPTGGINYVNVPYNGGPALQFADKITDEVGRVTGVGGPMAVMNATDLQSTSPTAMSQHSNAQMLIVEKSIRFFADTTLRYSFRTMVDQVRRNPDGAQDLFTRLYGNYTPLAMDKWDPEMDMNTTVAFGMMNKDYNGQILEKIIGMQTQAVQSQSSLATEQNIFAATVAFLENAGFKNTAAFVNDPSKSPDAGQKKPEKPSEAEIMAQAQKADTEAKAADAKQKNDLALLKIYMDDDRERDKMAQDFELKRSEIAAKYAAQVDIARVDAEVNAHRENLQQGFSDIAAMTQPKPQMPSQQAPQQAPQMPPQA
jgi:hypothetical protein